jgi:quinol monooxygenase YgiN
LAVPADARAIHRKANPQEGKSMILITGHMKIAPEKMAAARPLMRTMAEATRKEPGCLLYRFAEDVLEPGTISLTERWESQEALAEHMKTAHMAAWRAGLAGIGVLERDLWAHEAQAGKKL